MEINTYSGHHSIDFLQRKEKQSLVISYQTNQYFLTERKIPLFLRKGRQETCFGAASSIRQQHVRKPTVFSQPACAIGMGVWHLIEEAKLMHGISPTFSITLKKIPVFKKKKGKKSLDGATCTISKETIQRLPSWWPYYRTDTKCLWSDRQQTGTARMLQWNTKQHRLKKGRKYFTSRALD